jgi:acyl-CoA dehydrogenase
MIASGTTEPGTGGNFFYCNSAAEKTDGGWRFTAVKPVSTSAPFADYCFCITRADSEAPGAQLSFFMVPCKVAGVTQIGEWNTVGLRATQSSGLQFIDVPLTNLHLLGQEGGFGPIALTTMMPLGMCGFAACWLGVAQAGLDAAVEHVQRRIHRFSIPGDEEGHSIGSYESVQRQIAEANILLNQTRAFLYDVARSIDDAKPGAFQPLPMDKAFAIADTSLSLRVASGENAVKVTTTALRIAGAQGYRRDYLRIERCHRDALATQVMAPAPDTVKVFLGKLRLGYTLEQAIGL